MNALATLAHLGAIGDELQSLCDRLDDAECARNFLRDFFISLPADVYTWHCYAEDRIAMCPQYRALSDDAKRAVQWGFVPTARLVCRAGLPVSLADLESAAEFLRVCRDSVAEDDDVWETAENARTEVLCVIADREREEESIAEWRVARHERDTSWQGFGLRGE